MGCSSSVSAFEERALAEGVIDLALTPRATDADAIGLAAKLRLQEPPFLLHTPRWPRPDAAITGAGLLQLCAAGAASLAVVELNEQAIPNVSAAGAAQALSSLTVLRELSLRGRSFPRQLLAILSLETSPPLSSVRCVLLGGRGIDVVALAALSRACPSVERLYLQGQTDAVEWQRTVSDLAKRNVVFRHVEHLVFDPDVLQSPAVEEMLHRICPAMGSDGVQAIAPSTVPTSRDNPRVASLTLRSPRSIDAVVRSAPSRIVAAPLDRPVAAEVCLPQNSTPARAANPHPTTVNPVTKPNGHATATEPSRAIEWEERFGSGLPLVAGLGSSGDSPRPYFGVLTTGFAPSTHSHSRLSEVQRASSIDRRSSSPTSRASAVQPAIIEFSPILPPRNTPGNPLDHVLSCYTVDSRDSLCSSVTRSSVASRSMSRSRSRSRSQDRGLGDHKNSLVRSTPAGSRSSFPACVRARAIQPGASTDKNGGALEGVAPSPPSPRSLRKGVCPPGTLPPGFVGC